MLHSFQLTHSTLKHIGQKHTHELRAKTATKEISSTKVSSDVDDIKLLWTRTQNLKILKEMLRVSFSLFVFIFAFECCFGLGKRFILHLQS